ncbi:MAG: phosphatase PAP2 family protein [Candidatus Delongbacteria bacterium]|nr:phosphatase PAP2 family protein [Candidatus Delongbacteria bacterium]
MRILNRYYRFDLYLLVYNLLIGLLLIWAGFQSAHWWLPAALHFLFIPIQSILISRYGRHHFLVDWFRLTYPIWCTSFYYQELNHYIYLIGSRSLDSVLARLDETIFGFPISLNLAIGSPLWLNEWFHLCYFAYYFLIIGSPFLYLLRNRKDVLIRFMNSLTGAFYFSYLLFILLPAEGPRNYYFSDGMTRLDGYFFTVLAQNLVYSGGLKGGALPSTHCLIAVICWYYMYQFNRKLGYGLLIPVISLIIGTVWCRFHFAVDSILGILIAVVCLVYEERRSRT